MTLIATPRPDGHSDMTCALTRGEIVTSTRELEEHRDWYADMAHAHRSAHRRARFRGQTKLADACLAAAVKAEERATWFHHRAQQVRQAAIRSAT